MPKNTLFLLMKKVKITKRWLFAPSPIFHLTAEGFAPRLSALSGKFLASVIFWFLYFKASKLLVCSKRHWLVSY